MGSFVCQQYYRIKIANLTTVFLCCSQFPELQRFRLCNKLVFYRHFLQTQIQKHKGVTVKYQFLFNIIRIVFCSENLIYLCRKNLET